jgi:hypothetical protein
MSQNIPPQQPQVVYVRATPAKTPGTAALVLSILGFCGVTAVLGVILGAVARGEAKRSGSSTAKGTAAIVIGVLWILPVAIGLIVGATSSSSSLTPSATAPSTRAAATHISESDLVGGAWTVCKENVENQLKSPSSADFPAYSSSDIQTQVSGNVVGIVAWVGAENSFGASIRTPFTCSANYDPASDSYTVLADLNSTTMPDAAGAGNDDQDVVLALMAKRGFDCTGPQGKFDLFQCRKGTVKVPTYGTQPKELVNIRTNETGLSIDGYATPATLKALKKFGVKPYGPSDNGAFMMNN